jgi:hypothetical protein
MRNELYWVNGQWPGKLAAGPRPRGRDWLEDDIAKWKRARIDTVLSLLMPDEERHFNLGDEAGEVRKQGMDFISFPIPDRHVPKSENKVGRGLRDRKPRSFKRQECARTLPPGNRAQRTGCGLPAGEEVHEPRSRSGIGLNGARHIGSRNRRTARLDRSLRRGLDGHKMKEPAKICA